MTLIEIYHMIKWFMGRYKNKFTVTLVVSCSQTLTPISFSLKREPVPHRQYSDWRNSSRGDLMYGNSTNSWPLYTSLFYYFIYFSLVAWGNRNRLPHWWQNQKNELTCSWIAFISNPNGHPSSEIPMYPDHDFKRCTTCTSCCYRLWWVLSDIWYLRQ